jgi:hypothetical protein
VVIHDRAAGRALEGSPGRILSDHHVPMWREWLSSESWGSDLVFAPGADDASLRAVEQEVGTLLPEDLRALLVESDGVVGEYGLGVVWPAARIAVDNRVFRDNADFAELYAPFDDLLFFADAGNGDQFAFPATTDGVYVWDHEDDSRRRVADDLRDYLERWLSGALTI